MSASRARTTQATSTSTQTITDSYNQTYNKVFNLSDVGNLKDSGNINLSFGEQGSGLWPYIALSGIVVLLLFRGG